MPESPPLIPASTEGMILPDHCPRYTSERRDDFAFLVLGYRFGASGDHLEPRELGCKGNHRNLTSGTIAPPEPYCGFPAVANDREFEGDERTGDGRGSTSVLFCDPLDVFWLSVEAAAKRRSKGPDFCSGKVSTVSRNSSDASQSRSGCPRPRSG